MPPSSYCVEGSVVALRGEGYSRRGPVARTDFTTKAWLLHLAFACTAVVNPSHSTDVAVVAPTMLSNICGYESARVVCGCRRTRCATRTAVLLMNSGRDSHVGECSGTHSCSQYLHPRTRTKCRSVSCINFRGTMIRGNMQYRFNFQISTERRRSHPQRHGNCSNS